MIHRDFQGLSGHGFDYSTHFKGTDKGYYTSGIMTDLTAQLTVKSYQCLLFQAQSRQIIKDQI